MALSLNDPVSYANSEDYLTEHLDFDWTIDFDRKVIAGSVSLRLKNLTKKQADLKLDTKYLDIEKVSVNGKETQFEIVNCRIEALGSCLRIPIGISDEKLTISIQYATSDKCTALQWLIAEATYGKQYPYLFSQCQSIHARSLFPCQDSPSVKSTYFAKVKAPAHFNVLMSAIKYEDPSKEGKYLIHKFEQKVNMSSYLIAIVCGNLAGRKLSDRSTIWSEPEMVDIAAAEFSDTERLLSIAEGFCGDYVWGIYDILVLPPSSPYGGMENPCLTFVTPTLLVGDKSLVFVVAHEITHSWTGNLVTNKTWEDFWLNEGHTQYIERLIMAKYYDSEPIRHLLIDIGIAELQESLNEFGRDHAFNQLVPTLVECDPDDAFSHVPYEKGSLLLFHLENICGKDKMLRWLKCYFDHYKYKSLTTEEWKEFFYQYMTDKEKVPIAKLDSVDWNEWLYGRWQIPVKPELDRQFAVACKELADRWIQLGSEIFDSDKDQLITKYKSLNTHQKYYFLKILNDFGEAKLGFNVIQTMGDLYSYTSSLNSEILFGWTILCIRSQYKPVIDQLFEFLNSQGRLKYTKPIYRALYNWPDDDIKRRTVDNFMMNENRMHPITAQGVRQILGLMK